VTRITRNDLARELASAAKLKALTEELKETQSKLTAADEVNKQLNAQVEKWREENRKLYILNAQKIIDKQEHIDNLQAQVVALNREVHILKLGLRSPAGSVRRLEAAELSHRPGDSPSASPLGTKGALFKVVAGADAAQKLASPQQLTRTISGNAAATLVTGPISASLPGVSMMQHALAEAKEKDKDKGATGAGGYLPALAHQLPSSPAPPVPPAGAMANGLAARQRTSSQ